MGDAVDLRHRDSRRRVPLRRELAVLEGDQLVEVGRALRVPERLEQIPLADLPAGGQHDLPAGDGHRALHGEQALVDRRLDARGRQGAEVLAGHGIARPPREVDDAGDAHLLGHGELLALEPDEHAGRRGCVLDVAPAAVDRLVLLRVELRLPVGLGRHLIVVAQDRVDLRAGVVVALAGEPARQMPAVRQVGRDDQAVIGLIAGSARGCGHIPSVPSDTSN